MVTPATNAIVILANASAASLTVQLPAPSSVPAGKFYFIKKVDKTLNRVTIDAARMGGRIDGGASRALVLPEQALGVVSDGGMWWAVSNF